MDGDRFDDFTRIVAGTRSRRSLLRSMAGHWRPVWSLSAPGTPRQHPAVKTRAEANAAVGLDSSANALVSAVNLPD